MHLLGLLAQTSEEGRNMAYGLMIIGFIVLTKKAGKAISGNKEGIAKGAVGIAKWFFKK